MAKNSVQTGDTLDLAAPAGGVSSGDGFIVGSIFAVAQSDAAAAAIVAGAVEGVHSIAKLTTDVVAVGDKLNWNDTNKELQKATSDLDGVATAVEAAGNGVLVVKAKLTQV